MKNQGFVFVSVEGHYAAVRTSFDHGPTRQVITWVSAVGDAEVFVHDHMARRKFKELEKAQALQAVETRVVQLQTWVKPEPLSNGTNLSDLPIGTYAAKPEGSNAPANIEPPPPLPAPPFPQSQRVAWMEVDCDRRVRINGAMRYFGDDEALPLGVVYSQVEYQYGREAYANKFAGGGA